MRHLSLLVKPAAGLCNMECGYCFYRAVSEARPNAVMTAETVDALVGRIAEYRPSSLSVAFQGGEPTLAGLPFFVSFVHRIRERIACNVRFSLQTNGLLIDDAFARFLRENAFLVGVSLDGDRETNDRHRKQADGESTWERALAGIGTLMRHGVDVNILAVIDDANAADVDRTYAFFKSRGFECLQFIPCVGSYGGVSLSPEKYETFLKRSFDLWYDDLADGRYVSVRHIDNYILALLGLPPENCAMRGVCGGYFVVEADGALYPCDFYCREVYRLGSVFDEAPFEPGERMERFIGASKRIRETCSGCRYYALCRGGCRRDRTDDLTRNRYCEAYRGFFDYAGERLERAAEVFRG